MHRSLCWDAQVKVTTIDVAAETNALRVATARGSAPATAPPGVARRVMRVTKAGTRTRVATVGLVILMATALPWAQAVSLDPGTTPVDAGANDTLKLVLFALGGLIAWRCRRPVPLSRPARLMVAYAVVAAVGAATNHAALTENVFRSVRYAATVFAVSWLATHLGRDASLRVLMWFAAVQGAAAVIAQQAGLTVQVDGRLAGYIPNMHPNSLAIVVGIGLIVAVLRLGSRPRMWESALAMAPLTIAVVLTGSRTSLGAVVVGLVVAIIAARPERGLVLAWVTGLIVTITLLADSIRGTNTFQSLATRGGSAEVDTTFTGRTDGWSIALSLPDTVLEMLLGHGLSLKEVVVPGAAVPLRGVDGSWHSAYLQAGLVGVTLLAVVMLALLTSKAHRPYLPLTATLMVLFVLESQLNDVSFGMVTVLMLSAVPTLGPGGKVTDAPTTHPRALR